MIPDVIVLHRLVAQLEQALTQLSADADAARMAAARAHVEEARSLTLRLLGW